MFQLSTQVVIYKYFRAEFIGSQDTLVQIRQKVDCSLELYLILISLLEGNQLSLRLVLTLFYHFLNFDISCLNTALDYVVPILHWEDIELFELRIIHS